MRIGERWCALRAEAVREVVAPESITRVPAQPRYVLGVTIVHGRLVPVIHLGELVPGLRAKLDSPSGRRLIVTYNGDVEIGLVADDAKGVIHLPLPSENPALDPQGFIVGETRWNQHLVGMLNEERLVLAAVGAEGL